MKRGGPLRRTTPMKRAQSFTRRAMKAKRAQVTPEERAGRKGLKARSGGICEIDGHNPATDAHHRVNRSQGGGWALSNLLHLCSEHHMFVTVNPRIAQEQGWSVASHQDPAHTPSWLAGRGFSFLSDNGEIQDSEEVA